VREIAGTVLGQEAAASTAVVGLRDQQLRGTQGRSGQRAAAARRAPDVRGWTVYRTAELPVGRLAYAVERQVLRQLRKELELLPF
jgi:hypothetical protein